MDYARINLNRATAEQLRRVAFEMSTQQHRRVTQGEAVAILAQQWLDGQQRKQSARRQAARSGQSAGA